MLQGLGIRAAEGEMVRLSRELAKTSEEAGLPVPRLDLPAAGTFVSHLGASCLSSAHCAVIGDDD